MSNSTKIWVKLCDTLAARLGTKAVQIVGRTVQDCLNFLECNSPGFESWIHEQEAFGNFLLFQGDGRTLGADELRSPVSQIEIIEAVQGSGAVGRIVAGAALIGAAVAFPGAFPVVAIAGSQIALGAIALSIGVALALGGITQLLTPKQKENTESTSFGGALQRAPVGRSIPIAFGESFINLSEFGVFLSAGVDVSDVPIEGGKGK